MASDSDETTIYDYSDEELEGVAPIPVDFPALTGDLENHSSSGTSEPEILGEGPSQGTSSVRLVDVLDEDTLSEPFEPRQQVPSPPVEQIFQEVLLHDPPDVNSDGSRSPSLLDAWNINRDGSEPDELPVGEENCSERSGGRKRPRSDDESEDDGKTCPICLDNWTNLGEHRICALKCGHLFGYSCILRWFLTQSKQTCPTCKKKAAKGDIRYIYAKKLVAMDASELESMKTRLDDVTREKNRIQIELSKAVCREHLIMQQVEDLKKKVQYLDTALEVKRQFSQSQAGTSLKNVNTDSVRLYMDKSLQICKDAGCRVLDHCARFDLVMVSTKTTHNLFPGYGVRKINISTYRPTALIPLHSKPIRDIRFHPENPWLLSVSLDSTIKLVDLKSNSPISAYLTGTVPLWSCCWDASNSFILYVGKQQGSVAKFDVRKMNQSVCTLEVPGDMSPVVSIASIAPNPSGAVPAGGIISCKLNSMWVFENQSEEYVRHPLPMEGPFISMAYHNKQQQLLVSTRSNSKVPYSRHHYCSIEKGSADNLLCNTVHCYPGSSTQKLLSRSCILSYKDNYYVAAHEEFHKTVSLWSVSTGRKAGVLPARDDVLDLCGVSTSNADLLVALTEKKVEFFKFT